MRIELDPFIQKHAHANTRYRTLDWQDYFNAFQNILEAKIFGAKTLNFHLPYEIQFTSFRNEKKGKVFINFVQKLAAIIDVSIVWENANILDTSDWSLVENIAHTQKNIPLCLDIGHLILGSKNKKEAFGRIDKYLEKHGNRIKHLHLHINDLRRDLHTNKEQAVVEFLGNARYKKLVKGRTFIFEKGT